MSSNHSIPKKYQTGSALIIGLIILLLMFILGTAGMRTTILEERMAGNVRDLNNAFQAAELGLQDGEQELTNIDPITKRKIRPPNDDIYREDYFTAGCIDPLKPNRNGLCEVVSDPNKPPNWERDKDNLRESEFENDYWNPILGPLLTYREYGQYTSLNTPVGASTITPPPDLASVSRQPRYILEHLGPGKLDSKKVDSKLKTYFYRVTTQGYGIGVADTTNQPLAQVMLQSVYGR